MDDTDLRGRRFLSRESAVARLSAREPWLFSVHFLEFLPVFLVHEPVEVRIAVRAVHANVYPVVIHPTWIGATGHFIALSGGRIASPGKARPRVKFQSQGEAKQPTVSADSVARRRKTQELPGNKINNCLPRRAECQISQKSH